MNEQILNQSMDVLNRLISVAIDGVEGAVEFSKTEIPEVISQLLAWKAVESALGFAMGILIIVGGAILTKKLLKNVVKPKSGEEIIEERHNAREAYRNGEPWTAFDGKKHDGRATTSFEYDRIMSGNRRDRDIDNSGWYIASVFVAGVSIAFGTSFVFANLDWLKILIAPKLYLLEFAADLYNNTKQG